MIRYAKEPKQQSWKIVYSSYENLSKKAIDLISRELGKYIIRNDGVYTLYVLPCEKERKNLVLDKNAIIVSTFDESPLVRSLVDESELKDGYVVKTFKNPNDEDCSFIVLTAKDERSLYYGAIDLCYDFPVCCSPLHGSLRLSNQIFEEKIKPYENHGAPKIKTRSIFTWGHPINDYKAYLEDMARLRLNQLIIWNDYMPLNAKEIIDYAHSLGIEVIFGYAWGWQDKCGLIQSIDEEYICRLKEKVIAEYENNYANIGCDGIYFQSFTEMTNDTIGGRVIADVVADFVNETAGALLEKYPDLHIQFGLHATSVKNHLSSIGRVDKRVEIVWEDCGAFPFGYEAVVQDEEKFEKTKEFIRDILYLRGLDASTGFVFRGFATLDWEIFTYQGGSFVLGNNAKEISQHDRNLRECAWRAYSADWLKYGQYAQKMAEYIYEISGGNVNLCMAGLFDGGAWLPEALCSEIFWDPEQDYAETMRKVYARSFVEKV